ncbi:DUF6289 family protein [Thalassomonas actiniarum]|uniref:Uncharacterized protein n=1 Tax=Thalassomonas actiniarum TaxID=485447 RepID=A0AAE9YWS2_9GAMM|nr:DUF6289 family protein [Thalassomonas actiniarum]WDE02616.1 hypothetical protein SG35_029880 [Thalassomonas actiniarum]
MKTVLKKAAAIAVAALSFSYASHVYASYWLTVTYYSDASYSQVVGERIMNLCRGGSGDVSGTVTSYYKVTQGPSCGIIN